MVSRIAVIALVLIVACPILLGYAMNLNETTKTGYTPSGDSINLTEQLQNGSTGSSYNYAHGDVTQMNTDFRLTTSAKHSFPYFENITTQNASFPIFQTNIENQTFTNESLDLSLYRFFYIQFSQDTVDVTFYETLNGVEQLVGTKNDIYAISIEHIPSKSCQIYYYDGSGEYRQTTVYSSKDITRLVLNGGPVDAYYTYRYVSYSPAPPNDHYLDISAGYYFADTDLDHSFPYQWPMIRLPESTKQYTITMDLNSITDPTYSLHINLAPEYMRRYTTPFTNLPMELSKTTTDGVAKWTLRNEMDSSAPVTELYTDPTVSSNTYQFTISASSIYDETTSKYYLSVKVNAAYVGAWPTLIGVANPYITYDLDYVIRDDPNYEFNAPISDDDLLFFSILMKADNAARTPLMRVDDTLFRAFAYRTITDRTFLPSAYKENPGVTISNIKMVGTSITFGGVTYSVNGNAILVNGKSVKLEGSVFNTELNENGTYDNKINGIKVSTSATDLGMTFGGSWVSTVSVQSMKSYLYTTTEWTPGQFAWNGLDTNFLLVGMLTSLAAFIGLGIYARRHGASVIPLMIVCGCAAMLFFTMI